MSQIDTDFYLSLLAHALEVYLSTKGLPPQGYDLRIRATKQLDANYRWLEMEVSRGQHLARRRFTIPVSPDPGNEYEWITVKVANDLIESMRRLEAGQP